MLNNHSYSGSLHYVQLSADQFQVNAEWYYFAILSLIKTRDFKSEPKWIAERLGLHPKKIKDAVDRLVRLGLIQWKTLNGKKTLARKEARYQTTDEIPSSSVRRAHAQNLELAKDCLENVEIEWRDFTSLTMAIHPAKISLLKEKIRKFQDEISILIEGEESTEVYRMCIQLFPLTKIKGE